MRGGAGWVAGRAGMKGEGGGGEAGGVSTGAISSGGGGAGIAGVGEAEASGTVVRVCGIPGCPETPFCADAAPPTRSDAASEAKKDPRIHAVFPFDGRAISRTRPPSAATSNSHPVLPVFAARASRSFAS